ncbi:hypothetical protein [Burkholderia perseverans]|uniref:hypothetical protein n=1 Tax=Burkholderia perseverans TaxID=2615214 RepID=UPI001FEF7A51|nr:hypothetical protein [Burkholderia perseverans]
MADLINAASIVRMYVIEAIEQSAAFKKSVLDIDDMLAQLDLICTTTPEYNADPDAGVELQVYGAAVNNRALVSIEADDARLGSVCVMPIGITGIPLLTLVVKDGQRVKKGEQLGTSTTAARRRTSCSRRRCRSISARWRWGTRSRSMRSWRP